MAQRKPNVSSENLFTASDLARFCQVDLKTIHNWADRGELDHFRTPGRHLRFRRLAVVDFLRRCGFHLPEALRTTKPRVVVVDAPPTLQALQRRLTPPFEVFPFENLIDAIIELTTLAPDALVFDASIHASTTHTVLSRLRSHPSTAHVHLIAFGAPAPTASPPLDDVAHRIVPRNQPDTLREVLCWLAGLDPRTPPPRTSSPRATRPTRTRVTTHLDKRAPR